MYISPMLTVLAMRAVCWSVVIRRLGVLALAAGLELILVSVVVSAIACTSVFWILGERTPSNKLALSCKNGTHDCI